jgi:hypothetical protein
MGIFKAVSLWAKFARNKITPKQWNEEIGKLTKEDLKGALEYLSGFCSKDKRGLEYLIKAYEE